MIWLIFKYVEVYLKGIAVDHVTCSSLCHKCCFGSGTIILSLKIVIACHRYFCDLCLGAIKSKYPFIMFSIPIII